MRYLPGLMTAIAVTGLSALALPSSALAQQNPQGTAVPRQQTLSQTQIDKIVTELKVGIQSGNVDRVAATLSGDIIKNPQVSRLLAQTLGDSVNTRSIAFVTSVVERVAGRISGGMTGAAGIAAMQQFAGGVSLGVARTNPDQAAQMVQAVTSSAVSGGSKIESKVGEMARIVASGVVEAIVTGNTSINIASIAEVVRLGVSQGASKIVGSQVVVNVLATDEKPVSDVVITRADGKVLDKGRDLNFITVIGYTPVVTKPPPQPSPS